MGCLFRLIACFTDQNCKIQEFFDFLVKFYNSHMIVSMLVILPSVFNYTVTLNWCVLQQCLFVWFFPAD